MSHASKPFRFLDLPPEMQNKIYDMLVSQAGNRVIGVAKIFNVVGCVECPALTQVCRLLREETLPLFYGAWELKLYVHPMYELHDLLSWFDAQDARILASLRHVTFERWRVVYQGDGPVVERCGCEGCHSAIQLDLREGVAGVLSDVAPEFVKDSDQHEEATRAIAEIVQTLDVVRGHRKLTREKLREMAAEAAWWSEEGDRWLRDEQFDT